MWLNVIFIAILFIVAFIGFTGYSAAKENTGASNSVFEQLTKMQLNSQLKNLPEPVVQERPPGAMCYKVAAPPERAEYICPVCGEMTLYPLYNNEVDNISYYSSLVKKIKKIDVKLDESQMCKKCSPNAKPRNLCLIVKLKNAKNPQSHRTYDITENDINLLYEYSEGMKEHSTEFGNVPLSNYKNRLEELLGITIREFEK
jgi:ribosomal protein L37AE/L43A